MYKENELHLKKKKNNAILSLRASFPSDIVYEHRNYRNRKCENVQISVCDSTQRFLPQNHSIIHILSTSTYIAFVCAQEYIEKVLASHPRKLCTALKRTDICASHVTFTDECHILIFGIVLTFQKFHMSRVKSDVGS